MTTYLSDESLNRLKALRVRLVQWLEGNETSIEESVCVRVVLCHVDDLIAKKGNPRMALRAIDHALSVFG